ncbi:hypothetical protein ACHAQJ_002382 [Trichoderma viride]
MPYGANNAEEDFGVCRNVNGSTSKIDPTENYKMEIRFSLDPPDVIEKLSADILEKLPATTKHMTSLKMNQTETRLKGLLHQHSRLPSATVQSIICDCTSRQTVLVQI